MSFEAAKYDFYLCMFMSLFLIRYVLFSDGKKQNLLDLQRLVFEWVKTNVPVGVAGFFSMSYNGQE